MEFPARLPVLPRCYSPSPDRGFESHQGVPASRQPLRESTGNAQRQQQHPHMVWYSQHLGALSSIPPSISASPVLRTQSLGPDYGPAGYTRSQQRNELHLHGWNKMQGINPLMPLLTQAFQNYRKKQAGKPDQKWPDVLEGPFLDALLLIPQMRRKKYTMKQTQYGRNMLIGEYLWIAYCQTLAPGEEPDTQMMRERKKVSSHIQVLKNFFSNHRCFHFFFGPRQEDKDKDSIEAVSLKNNTVLIALSEGRLPDARPNYEYYSQILALNEQIQIRPKRCWIFVSHQDVVIGENGAGYIPGTGDKLGEAEYPHLARNLERESWAKEEQQIFKGSLLHEFTKEMHQVESSSVRELSRKWESAFPDLHQRLKAITSTTTDSRCDILHMHVTLELKEKRRFPSRSELNSWVEINIEQPSLLNHRWKVDTRLVRPAELSYSHEDSALEALYETSDEIAIQYQHRPGCDGPRNDSRGNCDCISQRCRRDWVTVPFPADVWALTLTNCAEYPAHPFSDSKKNNREWEPAVKTESDGDGEPRSRRRNKQNKQPTQMDLVPKIAMMQEIWSCPPSSPHEQGSSGSKDQRWTRRGLLLWTFETIHSVDEGKLVTAQGGRTNWRFLTILDPASEYHQRHAIINGRGASGDDYTECSSNLTSTSRLASRGFVMSPSPNYHQHLNTSMNESFSPAWDNVGGLGPLSSSAAQAAYSAHLMGQTAPSHGTTVPTGYGLLDSFSSHSGLATPPPTASLASSFAQPFDATTTSADLMPSYLATHVAVTTAGMAPSSHALGGGGLSAVTDPFLTHVGTGYDEAHNPTTLHGWNGHGVASGAAWPSSGYPRASGATSTHGHHGTVVSWAGPHSHTPSARGTSEHSQHHPYPHLRPRPHHHRQQRRERQPWESSTSIPVDNHGSHTTTTPQDPAHHDWVHIHTTASTVNGGGGSEVSQDWEEIAALPVTTSHSSPSPSLSASPAEAANHHHQQQQQHNRALFEAAAHANPSQSPKKSLKRGRLDGFGDDDDDGW